MDTPILAIAELQFAGQTMPDEAANAVEKILRTDENVNNLSIHSDKMIFFIWGKEKIDYSVLDRLKAEMLQRKVGFKLRADEYRLAGEKYSTESAASK